MIEFFRFFGIFWRCSAGLRRILHARSIRSDPVFLLSMLLLLFILSLDDGSFVFHFDDPHWRQDRRRMHDVGVIDLDHRLRVGINDVADVCW